MELARASTKGQVVIPVDIRRQLGIKPGTYFMVQPVDGKVVFTPLGDDLIQAARGMLADTGPSTRDLLEERAREAALEEARYERLTQGK